MRIAKYSEGKMKQEKIIRILTYFYLIPFFVMVFFNVGNSLLRTTYFELYKDMETAKYKWDNPFVVLLGVVVILAVLFLTMKCKWLDVSRAEKIALGFSGIVSLVIVLLFRCGVTCDSQSVSDIAVEFMQNNYASFEQGEYLYRYSFQLGIIAILELIYTIFGIENYIVFQLMNVACIMLIIYMLNKMTGELFESEEIRKLEAVLSMGMFPLFLFATFIYGDIPGWSVGICAVYFMIRYIKTDNWKFVLSASVLFSLGIIAKSNINVLVVAAVIVILLQGIYKKNPKVILLVILIGVVSQLGVFSVEKIYQQRTGLEEMPKGIPRIAWIAMSMQETDEGGYACGWYNGYNWQVYGDHDYDRERTSAACIENLQQSLQKMVHEQRYSLNFFYKKFTSQWNTPTFQAMITNEWYSRYSPPLSDLAQFFIYGTGRAILYSIMNIYHFFIFLGVSLFAVFRRKSWSLPQAYLILNIFGGFLFHMIWEAQSRYILEYFVLMLPLAACGFSELLNRSKMK